MVLLGQTELSWDRRTEEFDDRPTMIGETCGLSRCPLLVALRETLTAAWFWHCQFETEGLVRLDEMVRVRGPPPREAILKLGNGLRGGPTATSQHGQSAAHREVHAFDKSGLNNATPSRLL